MVKATGLVPGSPTKWISIALPGSNIERSKLDMLGLLSRGFILDEEGCSKNVPK
jgi:hypothetical protein